MIKYDRIYQKDRIDKIYNKIIKNYITQRNYKKMTELIKDRISKNKRKTFIKIYRINNKRQKLLKKIDRTFSKKFF